VSPDGAGFEFAGQRNVIVWDPVTKTEHFIRIANFISDDENLGFIAPTPGVPELSEVNAEVFDLATEAIFRYEKAIYDADLRPRIGCAAEPESVAAGAAAEDAVEILSQEDVGGYRATTLRARDAVGFRKWLAQNKFKTEKSIEEWIQFYMKKDWVFTAFLIKSQDGAAVISPVHMSFKTDRPYAPYYVPKANFPRASAVLEVAFYAPAVYQSVGVPADKVKTAPILDDHRQLLAQHLNLKEAPKDLAVSLSHYKTFPNPDATDDLFFHQTAKTPSWPVNLNPAKPYILAGIVGFFVVRAARRKSRQSRMS
jgi:hypothetical protein